MIYLQKDNPFGTETLIVEEDELSIWAYILDSKNDMIQDGFLCATGQLAENKNEIKQSIENGLAPPLLREYQNEYSIQQNLTENDIELLWTSMDEVVVNIRGQAFLRMVISSEASFSLALDADGPYGKKWKK